MELHQLVELLGPELLLWGANLTVLPQGQTIPPELEPFITLAQEVDQVRRPNMLPKPDRELSIQVNELRRHNGGAVPILGGTAIEDHLKNLATEYFPAVLIHHAFLAHSTHHYYGGPWFPLLSSSQRKTFEECLRADPDFGRAFAQNDGILVASETGSGGVQLALFASQILASAVDLSLLTGPLSLSCFHAAIDRVVAYWRTIFNHNIEVDDYAQIEVPASVGLHGVALPDDCTIDLTCGKLRSFRESDAAFLPHEARPTRMTNDSGRFVAAAVLEMTIPLRVALRRKRGKPIREGLAIKQINENTRRAAIALLLSTPEMPTSVVQAWEAFVDPTRQCLFMGFRLRTSIPHAPRQLTTDEVQAVDKWDSCIAKLDTNDLLIAIERIRRATGEQLSPEDGLLDAVIALESLLKGGGRQGGVTDRIASTVSILLAEPAQRLALKKEVIKIYGQRSDVVHGDKRLTHEAARTARDRTVQLFLQCLRVICERHPSLIATADRSTPIILGTYNDSGA